tara:strand:+ start:364 stop:666 length:303 start_codon:yes stop_codon:yes gene_type:complete
MGMNFDANQQQRNEHQQFRRDSHLWGGEGTLPSTPTFEDQQLLNGLRYGPVKENLVDKNGFFKEVLPPPSQESRDYMDTLRELVKHKGRTTEFGPTDWRK